MFPLIAFCSARFSSYNFFDKSSEGSSVSGNNSRHRTNNTQWMRKMATKTTSTLTGICPSAARIEKNAPSPSAFSAAVVISSPSSSIESGLYAARLSLSVSLLCRRFANRSDKRCSSQNSRTSDTNCTATAAVRYAASDRTADSPAPTASMMRPRCQALRNCAEASSRESSKMPAPQRTAVFP